MRDPAASASVDALAARLRRRQLTGSLAVAKEVAVCLRAVISRWGAAETLVRELKRIALRLSAAQPIEVAAGNIVRRILHTIREVVREDREDANGESSHSGASSPTMPGRSGNSSGGNNGNGHSIPSVSSNMLSLLMDAAPSDDDDDTHIVVPHHLKTDIIQEIGTLIDELKNFSSNIASQSLEHIHSNEIILTLGNSDTVFDFLKYAAKTRKFQVIVVETAPAFQGQKMALQLARAGVDVTLIPDSAIFAVMARVNKVILGCHIATANGGIVAVNGTHIVANAAKHHSIPVVVCAGLFKLSPLYPFDTDAFTLCGSSSMVYDFAEGEIIDKVDFSNPIYDYVQPELLSLFITNLGPTPPNYIYRVLHEIYAPADITLENLKTYDTIMSAGS